MGKSFNTGNLTNIIGYSGSNVAITGSVNISGTVVSTGTSLVSGSNQISYTGITNIPSGIVSGSSQVLNGSGIWSGSAQLPSGVVSGSAQTIANLPSGVVSGSAQVTTFGFGTTGSNTFQGSQTINGSLVVTGSLTAQQFIVSSSVTYLTESFASGSHKFGDSSDDTHQFTGSVLITGSVGINSTPNASFGLTNKRSVGSSGNLYLIGNDTVNGMPNINFYNDNNTSSSYISMNALSGLNLNGVMYISGSNIGIGVTPSFPLDLLTSSSGTFNTISQFFNNNFTSGNRSFIRVRQQVDAGGSSSSYFGTGQDSNLYIIANNSARGGDLIINAGTGAATFSSSVNVNGLATSANYKLGVTGAAFISGTNSKGVFITDSATYASIVGLNSAISAYNSLELRGSGTDYQLYLHTNGNVGLATSAPAFQLDVAPGVSSATLRVGSWAVMENVTTNQAMFGRNVVYATSIGAGWRNINTGGATAIRMYDDPGDPSIAFHLHASETAGTSLTSWDSTDVKMTIRNSGRVGILNTAPQGKLEVGIVNNNTTAGGHFFSTFQIPVNTWSVVFYAPSNDQWNAITEFTWTSAGDYNRSGAAYMRWAYNPGSAVLGVVYTLFNNSQNADASFRKSGNEIQVYITGGAADYYVQVRIQGSKAS